MSLKLNNPGTSLKNTGVIFYRFSAYFNQSRMKRFMEFPFRKILSTVWKVYA